MTDGHTPDLIERIERATGPDRVLDAEIAIAIKWPPMGAMVRHWVNEEPLVPVQEGLDPHHYLAGHVCMERLPDNGTWVTPAYTGSIDAAVTLLPEGWTATFWLGCDGAGVRLLDDRVHPERLPDVDVDAATLPLAIISASLKARAIP